MSQPFGSSIARRIQRIAIVPKLLVCLILLSGFQSTGFSQIREDPNVPADMKAVIGINVDVEALSKNPLFKMLLSMPADPSQPFEPKELVKVSALVSAPKSLDPTAMESVNYFIYFKFNNPQVGDRIRKLEMDDGGMEVTVGGRKVIKSMSGELPPGAHVETLGDVVVVASEAYMGSSSIQFASKNLADTYAKTPKDPIRLVIDMEGMRGQLDQAKAMLDEMAPAPAKPFLKLIDQTTALSLSSNIDQDRLLSLSFLPKAEGDDAKIKLALDAAVGLGKTLLTTAPPDAEPIKAIAEKVTVEAKNGAVVVDIPKPEGFEKMIIDAMGAAQGTADKFADRNTFKMALIGMLNYHDVFRKTPFGDSAAAEDANSGLNWAVRLLPYMEEEVLYDKFNIEESFDSEQNAPLAKTVPTGLVLRTGGQIRWVRASKVVNRLADITDGTSNTIAFVQDRTVDMSPWTKPSSISPADVIKQFQALKDGEEMIVGMYDGSVYSLSNRDDVKNLEAMLEPADGKTPERIAPGPGPGGVPDRAIEIPDGAKGDVPDDAKKGDDPFGKADDDPFGKAKDDPFGKADDDPFGK